MSTTFALSAQCLSSLSLLGVTYARARYKKIPMSQAGVFSLIAAHMIQMIGLKFRKPSGDRTPFTFVANVLSLALITNWSFKSLNFSPFLRGFVSAAIWRCQIAIIELYSMHPLKKEITRMEEHNFSEITNKFMTFIDTDVSIGLKLELLDSYLERCKMIPYNKKKEEAIKLLKKFNVTAFSKLDDFNEHAPLFIEILHRNNFINKSILQKIKESENPNLQNWFDEKGKDIEADWNKHSKSS